MLDQRDGREVADGLKHGSEGGKEVGLTKESLETSFSDKNESERALLPLRTLAQMDDVPHPFGDETRISRVDKVMAKETTAMAKTSSPLSSLA